MSDTTNRAPRDAADVVFWGAFAALLLVVACVLAYSGERVMPVFLGLASAVFRPAA